MRGNLRRSFSFQDEDNIHARNSNDVVTRRSSKVEGIFPDTARFKRKRKRKQSSTHFWPRLYEKKERKIRKALDYESIDKKKTGLKYHLRIPGLVVLLTQMQKAKAGLGVQYTRKACTRAVVHAREVISRSPTRTVTEFPRIKRTEKRHRRAP